MVNRFEVDLGGTWALVQDSDRNWYLAAFFCYYASFLVRGLRWRLIVSNSGFSGRSDDGLPSTGYFSLLILIGWFANSVGWFRVGDAYRAYALTESARVSFPVSLGTVLAERVMDVTAIFLLLVTAAVAFLWTRGEMPVPLLLSLGLGLVLVLLLSLLVTARFGGRLAGFLPLFIRGAYTRFHTGTLGGFKRLPLMAGLSITGWLLEVGRLYLVIESLGLSVSTALILSTAVMNAFLTAVPLTPGGVGIVEPGISGLLSLGLSQESAIAVAVLDRSISYLSIIALGGLAFALWNLRRFRRARGISDRSTEIS